MIRLRTFERAQGRPLLLAQVDVFLAVKICVYGYRTVYFLFLALIFVVVVVCCG